MFDNSECTRCTAGQCKRAKKGRRAGKKERVKDGGKRKKRAYRHLFKLTSVRPLSTDFQKCQNVRCRRVFKRLCHVCLTLRPKPQKSDWLEWWRKLSNLTNRTVYQNEVLKTMLTGLTVYGPHFPVSPQPPLAQGVWGLSQRCARSIWLICYRKTSLESSKRRTANVVDNFSKQKMNR